ncbi:hypothetical protein BTVI_32986 [Pitangus sulphuratus]|nr:hypothetical protein BTVI_32986 [Pitangus sulphuratus]
MKNVIGPAKLEYGKVKRTHFHTKDKGEELEEAFRDWKMLVHRDKDKKKGEESIVLQTDLVQESLEKNIIPKINKQRFNPVVGEITEKNAIDTNVDNACPHPNLNTMCSHAFSSPTYAISHTSDFMHMRRTTARKLYFESLSQVLWFAMAGDFTSDFSSDTSLDRKVNMDLAGAPVLGGFLFFLLA